MNITKKNAIKGEAILLLTSILWGSCFIFQKKGMDYIGPFTLGALRFLLGGLILIPFIMLLQKGKSVTFTKEQNQSEQKLLLKGGFLCGVSLFFAATFQQVGLVYTTAGKAAFLTSLEIVVVEILGIIILRKLLANTVIGVILAVLGTYLLCITNGFSMEYGDILALVGAFFWGIQIIAVDKYAKLVDGMKLAFLQFMVAGFLSLITMFLVEAPNIADIISCAIPILYTAVIEVALCYTLQIIGQKYVSPVIAAVTLSLESVFAVIFGAILLKEALTGREISGMLLMLAAVIIIQFPMSRLWKKKK